MEPKDILRHLVQTMISISDENERQAAATEHLSKFFDTVMPEIVDKVTINNTEYTVTNVGGTEK